MDHSQRPPLDVPNASSHTGRMRDEPDCPPIVLITGGAEDQAAFLLAWEVRESAPSEWSAWVAWIRETGGRQVRHVTTVRAARLRPLEPPENYRSVPRHVRCMDGVVRPWSPPAT
jgi:hypothetical protein